MALLGSKDSARVTMARAGLPLLPGSTEPLDLAGAVALAGRVGFPLLIKAVAGGGGQGMAVAEDSAELPQVFQRTRASAAKLFTDGRVYAERYLRRARHVEVQVLADRYGRVIHLGERDCSMQRRRQKVVEEAPAPALPASLVEQIREVAVAWARAVGYQGAGTFEFIVDDELGFYFMEVNCRIQVEHPVTELFLLGGPFVRVDTHVHPGYSVPPEYDSLLAKVVAWAPDRDTAIARMRRALREARISGPGLYTAAGFLDGLLGGQAFVQAEHSTAYIDQLTRG